MARSRARGWPARRLRRWLRGGACSPAVRSQPHACSRPRLRAVKPLTAGGPGDLIPVCDLRPDVAHGARPSNSIHRKPMGYENLTVAIENRLARVTMNRPKVLNALNEATIKE